MCNHGEPRGSRYCALCKRDGMSAKIDAITQVSEHADGTWWAASMRAINHLAKTRDTFTADDVYSIFATKIYKQPISKANPVERFVGKTCILGLGYGTGAAKLRHTLKTQPPGADLSEEECKRIVDLYRSTNDKIVELWRECDYALKCMMSWPEGKAPFYLGVQECVVIDSRGIRLPNGLYIRYPNLRSENDKLVYDSRKGTVSIWGGAMVENVVQALARIVVGEQMLNMRDTYRPVLTVHDAAVIVAPKPDKDQALAFITQVMSTAPNWATGLLLSCCIKSFTLLGSGTIIEFSANTTRPALVLPTSPYGAIATKIGAGAFGINKT